jgi:phage terminase Nu1 subunit (DNA packaging protein)
MQQAAAVNGEDLAVMPVGAPEEDRPDEFYHVNLGQLSDVTTVSQTTLRIFIRKYTDFPIVKGGTHGVPYVFDVRAVTAWLEQHAAEAEADKRAEQDRTAQLRLFFGEEPDPDPRTERLSPREESELMDARLKALKLSRENGKVLIRSDVEASLSAAFLAIRDEVLGLTDLLSRELSLDREQRNMVETRIERALRRCCEKLGAIERPTIEGDLAAPPTIEGELALNA